MYRSMFLLVFCFFRCWCWSTHSVSRIKSTFKVKWLRMDMCVLTILFFVCFFRLHTISINYIMLLFFFLLFNTHVTNIRTITTSIWSCCSMHIKLCGSGGGGGMGGWGGLVCPPSDELNGIREFFLHVSVHKTTSPWLKKKKQDSKQSKKTLCRSEENLTSLTFKIFFFLVHPSVTATGGSTSPPKKREEKAEWLLRERALNTSKWQKKTKNKKKDPSSRRRRTEQEQSHSECNTEQLLL